MKDLIVKHVPLQYVMIAAILIEILNDKFKYPMRVCKALNYRKYKRDCVKNPDFYIATPKFISLNPYIPRFYINFHYWSYSTYMVAGMDLSNFVEANERALTINDFYQKSLDILAPSRNEKPKSIIHSLEAILSDYTIRQVLLATQSAKCRIWMVDIPFFYNESQPHLEILRYSVISNDITMEQYKKLEPVAREKDSELVPSPEENLSESLKYSVTQTSPKWLSKEYNRLFCNEK